MPETIVVVGRRLREDDGSYRLVFSKETGAPGVRYYTSRQVDENGGVVGDPEIGIAVKIEKTKSETDQAKLEEAARKLVEAAINLITKLESSDPTALMVVLDRIVTVGEMLQTLLDTQFTITDATNFGNNGVGTARRGIGGSPNIDVINYEAIIGGSSGIGYGDPAYPDNSGINALVLHEVAHMTQAGYDFYIRSTEVARADPTDNSDFYQTEYASNLEAFANELMTETSLEIGVDLHGVRPGTSAAPVTPESIYQSHTGQPYPG